METVETIPVPVALIRTMIGNLRMIATIDSVFMADVLHGFLNERKKEDE